ncbi:MAG: diguanylate cyclase, partial [Proteobacteria bacterium]|nr:diguanylate cyclase [Pseudomonadota bacterium]
INGSVREGVDSGYRYGGDEFAVMLIEADATVAEMMSVRIRNGIKEACDLTASAGCAVFYDNLTAEELVGEADQRLYELKERKKNRKGLKRVPRN